MTRFARAKGSKASNERQPEEATPWNVMKQQIMENVDRLKNEKRQKEVNEQKTANYRKFLQEKDDEESRHAVWASFPVQRNKSLLLKHKQKNSVESTTSDIKVEKKLNIINNCRQIKTTQTQIKLVESTEEKNVKTKKEKNKGSMQGMKVEKKQKPSECKENEMVNHIQTNKLNHKIKKVKKRNLVELEVYKKIKMSKQLSDKEKEEGNHVETANLNNNMKEETKKTKRMKMKLSETNKNSIQSKKVKNLTENDLKKMEKKKQKRLKQLLKKKEFKEKLREQKNIEHNNNAESEMQCSIENKESNYEHKVNKNMIENTNTNSPKENNGNLKKSVNKTKGKGANKKLKSTSGEHQRKKQQVPHKLFVNGRELEIAYVEGFPVKKEDAERLKKLKKEMISRGLPRSQIDAALKLERRKAEKALAREKKKVCFNCRKSGHNLSECPEIGKNQLMETSGSGICFKCGSAEHTHFECKVVRGQEYKFAQCFICNEQGHIARQCPDNARGLYPKGGACKVCGDVTHLKKDCPQYQAQQQKQEDSLSLQTLGDNNPEMLEETKENRSITSLKKQNKIIKFV